MSNPIEVVKDFSIFSSTVKMAFIWNSSEPESVLLKYCSNVIKFLSTT